MTIVKLVQVLCDNQSVISIVKNSIHRDRTKYVEIDKHFIKEKLEGVFQLSYTPTNSQVADILTKALPMRTFDELSYKVGLNNIYNPA